MADHHTPPTPSDNDAAPGTMLGDTGQEFVDQWPAAMARSLKIDTDRFLRYLAAHLAGQPSADTDQKATTRQIGALTSDEVDAALDAIRARLRRDNTREERG